MRRKKTYFLLKVKNKLNQTHHIIYKTKTKTLSILSTFLYKTNVFFEHITFVCYSWCMTLCYFIISITGERK